MSMVLNDKGIDHSENNRLCKNENNWQLYGAKRRIILFHIFHNPNRVKGSKEIFLIF